MTPFFSVVIPVYNRVAQFGHALRSVLAGSEQDFEIVVVDDGSTDNPARVVEELADPRILFLRQENAGGGAARNAGIDKAQGRYIAFLDSDDTFLPHHLSTMRKLLEPGRAGYARILVDRGDGKSFLKPPRAIREGEDMATYLLCERGFIPTSTMVVERGAAQADPLPRESARRRGHRFRHPPRACRPAFRDGRGARRALEGHRRSQPPVGGAQQRLDARLDRGT